MYRVCHPSGSITDFGYLCMLAMSLVLVQLINSQLDYGLRSFGIWPRELYGIPGIVLSIFLHGSWLHLATNVASLGLLGVGLLHQGVRLVSITPLLVLTVGTAVWLLGSLVPESLRGVHIGASGLVFGYLGMYLVGRGIVGRCIIMGLVFLTFLLNYAIFGGVLSWESHLFGLVSGVTIGWFVRWAPGRLPPPGPAVGPGGSR